ncbi:MAG: SNF2-related protein [Eubacteriales bacterium]
MLLEKMYVRCPIDYDMINPRDFLMGQITKIDSFADTVEVVFNDPFNYRVYYASFPKTAPLPTSLVQRCQFFAGSTVLYEKEKYTVVACVKNEDVYYDYYIENAYDKEVICVSENRIVAPFTVGKVDPALQLRNYEFQNPYWLFGRSIVTKTMNVLDNSIMGFKELAGCKIFLMPHQLKSIMRCLQDDVCRYMLADEVGMGKTIEAASILKVYFSRHSDINALIVVPGSLLDQWKTELFLKFDLYEGENENNNFITFAELEKASENECVEEWDFTIVDEAHRLLKNKVYYEAFHKLSNNTSNLLLLSATPVQQKRSDYLDLLRLILPLKYDSCTKEKFNELVEKQGNITKVAAMVLSNIEDLDEVLRDSAKTGDNPHDNEDSEDFYDDIESGFKKLYKLIGDEMLKEMYEKADFDEDDMGIHQFKVAISYLCENYQIEKNIIRNRRDTLEELPERKLKALPYALNPDKNFYEYGAYQDLVTWITEKELTEEEFVKIFKPLFGAFFSSPWAFEQQVYKLENKNIIIPNGLKENLRRWKMYEQDIADNIVDVLDEPEEHISRIVQTMYYLDEYASNSKIVLFTNYQETFEIFKKMLADFYTDDGFSCFRKEMSSDELEVNVCRFQNDKNCTIMLCDESGGEGRNFQRADYVVHIDLPWDANIIEQRIGRLDRMGRKCNRPIVSVVPYAEETLEEELFKFWDNGLKIFNHSLSGLEIIMNDINNAIVSAIIKDFRFGLTNEIKNVIDRSVKLKEEVREEQHFDTAAYIYRPMNQELISLVKYYNRNENKMFSDAMLQWARLSGFRNVEEKDEIISFNDNSFSTRSAENSLLIPPDWDSYFEQRQNQFISRVHELRQDSKEKNTSHYSRSIEGTFSRKKSIENDYIHFFAPGDDIFDCIVDNAMRSCRGQAAAFAMKANFNWTGFIYTWSLYPNERLLIEKEIPLSYLSIFRNYLSVEQVQVPVRVRAEGEISDEKVIREFSLMVQRDFESSKDDIDHLGRRSKNEGFLHIFSQYRASNIDYFRSEYLQDRWGDVVKKSRKLSKHKALDILKERSHIADAKSEMDRILTSMIATSKYYNHELENYEKMKEIYNVVLQSLSKPTVRLESACYVWMVNK